MGSFISVTTVRRKISIYCIAIKWHFQLKVSHSILRIPLLIYILILLLLHHVKAEDDSHLLTLNLQTIRGLLHWSLLLTEVMDGWFLHYGIWSMGKSPPSLNTRTPRGVWRADNGNDWTDSADPWPCMCDTRRLSVFVSLGREADGRPGTWTKGAREETIIQYESPFFFCQPSVRSPLQWVSHC